ncbi:transcription repressor NadR [Ornithinibacillus gellani]|uniref:transcription repressor NadR n=1 Tax=Ornithinibacillus gellani TaxID=2293253 RepID=UPI000F4923DE|nr:transcription repressor NadR [Ornithinibacillus gellani]TQS74200.1 transcription repressor NadR [Ornithinibacillus gellani]
MIQKKMSSSDRQQLILERLTNADHPITGSEFAQLTSVSRQVIVQDVSIMKAKKIPIIATSQGYLLVDREAEPAACTQIIVCQHTPEQTKEELYVLVDHGVFVKDVIVEHAVYGDLTASVMVGNRMEVDQFVQRITETEAAYLSTLTKGIHLHTLEADSMEKIIAACQALERAGILIPS